jgi:hypothetical protein
MAADGLHPSGLARLQPEFGINRTFWWPNEPGSSAGQPICRLVAEVVGHVLLCPRFFFTAMGLGFPESNV